MDEVLLPDAEHDLPAEFFLPHVLPSRPFASPAIECPELDYRSWRTWREAALAMSRGPTLPFVQAWRPEDEPGLRPASVALAHHGDELILYAELSDADIFNPVRANGEPAYQTGDVFEMFLRAEDEENYFEHHITPGNCTFQLSFPSLTAFAEHCSPTNPDWFRPLVTAIPVRSRVLVQPEIQAWRVLALVPLGAISSRKEERVPPRWRFSISRYDRTRGRKKPVLSSTTPYRLMNFHHQEMWGVLSLRASSAERRNYPSTSSG